MEFDLNITPASAEYCVAFCQITGFGAKLAKSAPKVQKVPGAMFEKLVPKSLKYNGVIVLPRRTIIIINQMKLPGIFLQIQKRLRKQRVL